MDKYILITFTQTIVTPAHGIICLRSHGVNLKKIVLIVLQRLFL